LSKRNGFLKGRYGVEFPNKYSGDISKVTYRSSWELFFMTWCDHNPKVKRWSSETVVVNYYSQIEDKPRRYFIDFEVQYIDGTVVWYEVKPKKQTIPPKYPKKPTLKAINRFTREREIFNINLDKWEHASNEARRNGYKFRILTEKDLFDIGMDENFLKRARLNRQ